MNKSLIIFLSCWAVFVVSLFVVILNTEQADLHLALTLGWIDGCSQTSVKFQDFFFKYITELGSSIPFVVAAALLFYKLRDGLLVLLAQGVTALLVTPAKYLFFAPRPSKFFADNFPDICLHQVDGVHMHQVLSFPSGHTAAVFSFMLSLTYICRKKWWCAPIFFVLAVTTAYSRIYLSQHFAEDICAGSLFGIVATLLTIYAFNKYNREWLEMPIHQVVKKNNSK